MVTVKPMSEAKKNFEDSTTLVRGKYEAGINRADWATAAHSDQAEQNFASAMNDAIARKTRQSGVRGVSNESWKSRAKEKGAPNIAQNMRVSSGKWSQNVAPYFDTLENLSLPARTADPVQNVQRVVAVVEALVAKKRQLQGS